MQLVSVHDEVFGEDHSPWADLLAGLARKPTSQARRWRATAPRRVEH
jgi:hypothetical protein